MARKKIREYDSKRLLKEHLKRLAGIEMDIKSAQVCLVIFKLILSFLLKDGSCGSHECRYLRP